MEFVRASDSSVLAVLGTAIGEEASARVISLFRHLDANPPEWLENLHPAYTTLLVDFDPRRVAHDEVEAFLAAADVGMSAPLAFKTVEVPVVYDGPDLADLAARHGLTAERAAEIHREPPYHVVFLGFMPGFAYLSGLPSVLATPRRETPRLRVPAGSVAIGGAQTAVYPDDSPGGWHWIGHTPMRITPEWVEPGDRVRFVRT